MCTSVEKGMICFNMDKKVYATGADIDKAYAKAVKDAEFIPAFIKQDGKLIKNMHGLNYAKFSI